MISLSLYLLFGFLILLIYEGIRLFYRPIGKDDQKIALGFVSVMGVIFGLMLSFTIANFYSRYQELTDIVVNEVTDLQLIYRMLLRSPGSEDAVASMKAYLKGVIDTWLDYQNGTIDDHIIQLYRKMDAEILDYIRDHPDNIYNQNILSRLSTNQHNLVAIREVVTNKIFIYVIIVAALFLLLGLYWIHISNLIVQTMLDLSVISIVVIGIYLLYVLSAPFSISGFGITPQSYQDLLNEILS